MYSSAFQMIGTLENIYENSIIIQTLVGKDELGTTSEGWAVTCQNPKVFDDYLKDDIRIFVKVKKNSIEFVEGSKIEKVVPATNEDDQFGNY